MKYRIAIVSNSAEWCECLTAAFKISDSFHVLGTFSTPELIEAGVSLYPDVILWKVNGDPKPVISEAKARSPLTRLVIVLRDPGEYNMTELIHLGLHGCLPMRLLPKQIVSAVELIMDAGVLCLPRFGPEYHNKINSQDDFSLLGTLTKREQEVFTLLRKGLTNSEIASALYISESTVKSHLRSIFRKLGIKKRNEAQILALQGINTTGTKAVTG